MDSDSENSCLKPRVGENPPIGHYKCEYLSLTFHNIYCIGLRSVLYYLTYYLGLFKSPDSKHLLKKISCTHFPSATAIAICEFLTSMMEMEEAGGIPPTPLASWHLQCRKRGILNACKLYPDKVRSSFIKLLYH